MLIQLCWYLGSDWLFLSLQASHFLGANAGWGVLSFPYRFQLIHLGVLSNFGSHGFASSQLRKGTVWTFLRSHYCKLSWIEMQVRNPICHLISLPDLKMCKMCILSSSSVNLFCYLKKNIYIGCCNCYWSLVLFTYNPSGLLYKTACFENHTEKESALSHMC